MYNITRLNKCLALTLLTALSAKPLYAAAEADRITMDSVRTAIMVGKELQQLQQESAPGEGLPLPDTTYIDGRWPVATGYLRRVLGEVDLIADYNSARQALVLDIDKMTKLCASANATEMVAIGFALRRQAARYPLLLTPAEFAIFWNRIHGLMETAEQASSPAKDYFVAALELLRRKVNESVRLQMHDQKRHDFLRQTGFTVTRNEGGRWYYAVSGKHYSGDNSLEYLDGCAEQDSVLCYHAEHRATGLLPGIYRLTAAGRVSGQGESGAFIFAESSEARRLAEIPACDDRGGSIWRDAALRVKQASDSGLPPSPRDVRIALANGGIGYGWSKVEIPGIVVTDGKLTYGLSCDPGFTSHPFLRQWLSACDFKLERTGDLPHD